MEAPLHAALTRTHRGDALAVVDGLPGGGAELTPAQLRRLADGLIRIADECASQLAPGKRARLMVHRDYLLRA